MRRRLFTILSALSLLLCMAIMVLWVRSYWSVDAFVHTAVEPKWFEVDSSAGMMAVQRLRVLGIGSVSGRIYFARSIIWGSRCGGWSYETGLPSEIYPFKLVPGVSGSGTCWDMLGFGRRHQAYIGLGRTPGLAHSINEYWIPHWLACLAVAILPVHAVVRLQRSYRRWWCLRQGLCAACEYDLRASEGRCPECGTPIPTNMESCSQNQSV